MSRLDRSYQYFYDKIRTSQLPANAVNVYKALLQYANRTTWCCFPSVKTIAYDTKLSVRTVRRQLTILEARGYILRIPRKRENQGYTSNMYFLN